jgi:hypothetical protein
MATDDALPPINRVMTSDDKSCRLQSRWNEEDFETRYAAKYPDNVPQDFYWRGLHLVSQHRRPCSGAIHPRLSLGSPLAQLAHPLAQAA